MNSGKMLKKLKYISKKAETPFGQSVLREKDKELLLQVYKECAETGTYKFHHYNEIKKIYNKLYGIKWRKYCSESTGLRGSIKTGDNKHLKEPTHLRGSSFVSSAETPRNDCAEHTVSDVKARNGREQRERHLRISANPKLISREKA